MKKIFLVLYFVVLLILPLKVDASTYNETIKKQEDNLKISDFIDLANNYTKQTFQDVDLNQIYKNAISGNINTDGFLKRIFNLISKELNNTLKTIGYIFIIIIVHSIIKNISEGVGNGEIGQITYYVQYILIVTLIMTNFSEIIVLIKDTINNLVGFLNSLLPILLTLMVATGNLVTASTIQPILLVIITFTRKHYFFCFYTVNTYRDISWNNIESI